MTCSASALWPTSWGHSLHSYNAWHTQPMIYADYSIFVAEVASNFNQAMVRNYLFRQQPNPAFQIALIEEAMSNFHRYFFIMPTLARLELEMHRRVEHGQGFTADDLLALTADLFAEGYGDEVVIDQPRSGITWAAFHTHLYSNFYVYQYTTGISAAHALVDRVASGEPGAVADYRAFLSAGQLALSARRAPSGWRRPCLAGAYRAHLCLSRRHDRPPGTATA